MNTSELFDNKLDKIYVNEYISFFYREILKYNNSYFYEEIDIVDGIKSYVSIIKDNIDRLDKSKGGSGFLRLKPYSIFIFTFISKDKYKKVFGTNSQHRRIQYKDANYINFELTEKVYSNSKKNEEIIRVKQINELIQFYIKKNINEKYKSLLVNAYVHSCNILFTDCEEICKNDYLVYYFDKNYKFRYKSSKDLFKSNYNINSLIHSVNDVKSEIEQILTKNDELINLVKAYTGELHLTSVTKNNYESIVNDINNGVEYILTEGFARTGKTIICMRLLNDFSEANLLLMNLYFYKSLVNAFSFCDVKFPYNRIFHPSLNEPTGSWNNGLNCNLNFLIVDEAQRLGVIPAVKGRNGKYFPERDQLKIIFSATNHKHTIFFGDRLQAINSSLDRGFDNITKKLNDFGLGYKKYYFEYSIGIPLNILNSMKYLVYDQNIQGNSVLNDFEINLFNSKDKFIESYEMSKISKKHLASIYYPKLTLGKYEALPEPYSKKFEYFLDSQIKSKYILFPHHIISRELDELYIYIPKHVSIKNNKINCSEDLKYLLNQLYVLFTRARLSLNIYCENDKLLKYFGKKIENLMNNTELQNNNINNLSTKSQKMISMLEQIIEEKGITRLIHFTEAKNIESILKYGILSVKELKERGIPYDNNDSQRLDGHLNAISLSVQNPNQFLLRNFIKKYPNKKYKAIILHPALLFCINNPSGTELAKRLYCNYNAAARITKKSLDDISTMYEEAVQMFSWKTNNSWVDTRKNLDDNETTSNQAEILFFESIPCDYILDIKDLFDDVLDEE